MSSTQDRGLSLWLIPPTSYKPTPSLKKLTSQTFPASPKFPDSPAFQPHITLTSRIPTSSQLLLPSMHLEALQSPDIQFDELSQGKSYFKFIFLRIKKTHSLLALVKQVREFTVPNAEPFAEEVYDPHISLVYSSEEVTEGRLEYVASKTSLAIGESRGWIGGNVALVDTRSDDLKQWKVLEEWSFPETI
jgi:2'-5' RNA ligase